jgi:hypothetical protein
MPSETERRRWVEQWQAAREALRLQRASELAALSDDEALAAADALLTVADVVELPAALRTWSGLVEQQALFQKKARS